MAIRVGSYLCLVVMLAASTFEQHSPVTVPNSPCPNVFMYEPPEPGSEPGRWYGLIHLSTDTTLQSLLLSIRIDDKADLLGNWIGDVSTQNNQDFNIENADIQINAGQATSVRFFVQYNPLNKAPRIQVIKLNGREICNIDAPHPIIENYDEPRALKVEVTTKSRGWQDIWPEDEPKTKQGPAQLSVTEKNRIDYSIKPFTSSSSASNNEVTWQKMNLGLKSDLQRTTSRPSQATHNAARILAKNKPEYDDDDASYDDTRKDYFDGHSLIRPGNRR